MTIDPQVEKELEKQEAREMNRDPITGEPGAHPVTTGIGAAGGAVAGALVGTVAGPVGTVLGSVVGAFAGGFVGSGAGEAAHPTAVEADYWRVAHVHEPYYNANYNFDDYGPAYLLGYDSRGKSGAQIWDEQQEIELRREWESSHGRSRLSWDEARHAVRASWMRNGGRIG